MPDQLPVSQAAQPPVDDTCALATPASVRRLPVAWLLFAGILLGLIGALLYGRATGTGVAPTAAGLLQTALQAVTGSEPAERIVFSTTQTPPALPPDLLPSGVPAVYCSYDVPGVRAPGAPSVTLSKDGKKVGPIPAADVAAGTRAGTGALTLKAQGGFQPGIYEVELQFADSRVTASFVTARGAEAIVGQPAPRDAEVVITQPAFALGVRPEGKPQKALTTLRSLDKVYFVFQYDQAEPGSAVQVKWYGGPQLIEAATREVLLPSVKGWANAWLQAPVPGLPPGKYRAAVNMSSDPHELVSAEFTIIEGQSPTPAAPTPPQRP